MKASVPIGLLAFVALASPTPAHAHNVERVKRELRSQGYEQIEFVRTKFPVWVNACRGSKRLHLHVDWYGKVTVTDDAPTGSCPTAAEYENSSISSPAVATHNAAAKKSLDIKRSEGELRPQDASVGCKKFFPEIGMTVTVPCE